MKKNLLVHIILKGWEHSNFRGGLLKQFTDSVKDCFCCNFFPSEHLTGQG